MNSEFNINVFSHDANFCSALALECNKYGFELSFFEVSDVPDIFKKDKYFISIIIIDLSQNEDEALQLGEKARINSNFPLFGVVDVLNKKIKHKSKDFGFDLIFTKQILLKSIKKVIIHISNQ